MESKNLTTGQLVAGLVCAAAVIGGLVVYNNTGSRSAMRGDLEGMAESLRAAASKGDAAAATRMQEPMAALLRRLNDGSTDRASQPCLLPAMHLSDGVLAVAQGGPWASEPRYATSVQACK